MHKGMNSTLDEGQTPVVTHSNGAWWNGDQVTPALTQTLHRQLGRDGHGGADNIGAVMQPVGFDSYNHAVTGDVSKTLDVGQDYHHVPNVFQPIPFDTTQITSPANYSRPQAGDACHPIAAGAHVPAIAFHPTQDPISSSDGTTHAMGCGSSGGMATIAVAQPVNIYGGNKRVDRPEGGFYVRMDEETSKTLDAATGLNPTCSQGGTAVMQPIAIQDVTPREKAQNGKGWNDDGTSYTVDTHATQGVAQPMAWSIMPQNSGKDYKARQVDVLQPLMAGGVQHGNQGGDIIQTAMQVRRLTPVECERLQGFPDNYTAIAWRKKPASECPDGPRYKALGNSWAVPVVRWIGKRIEMEIKCKPKK
jgi:hypothetical protein